MAHLTTPSPLLVAIPFSSGLCSYQDQFIATFPPTLSQSLFLQVFVPTIVHDRKGKKSYVAIPFSSGLCSYKKLRKPFRSRDINRRNPFFFRSLFLPYLTGSGYDVTIGSQSLFLQVFVPTHSGEVKVVHLPTSQSLFLQVFVPTFIKNNNLVPLAYGSQSLFLQVFVPTHSRYGHRYSRGGRNPFFFRSLFLQAAKFWANALSSSRNPFFFRSLFLRRRYLRRLAGQSRNPFFFRSLFLQRTSCTMRVFILLSQSLFLQVFVPTKEV